MIFVACGGGGSPAPARDECARDADCDDRVLCTRDACVPSVGGVRVCQHEPRDDLCPPGERCVVGVLDLAGCRPEAVVACLGRSDGAACDVSDLCRAGPGTCRQGRCEYSAKLCPEQPCHASQGCDPATGDCRYEALADGSLCVFPADACRPARCRQGECEPTGAALCDDGNPCTQDICNVNECEHRDLPDGTACDEGDLCTVGESCAKGVCGGGSARVCDDRNDCTSDVCDSDVGCVSEAVLDGADCFAGGDRCRPGHCEAGACVGVEDLHCNDLDPCTIDLCDPTHGCRHEPQSNVPCDDGNECTKDDRCKAGQCVPGGAVTCEDQDPCTADSCDPTIGCAFAPITPCCGNRVVEDLEQCDAGPAGSEGCGPDCRYRLITLAAPPSGGRYPSVAWSAPLGSGLVAYEAAPVNRVLVARRVGLDLAITPERPVRDYKVTGVHDIALIATPGGPKDFLAAVSRPVAVDLFGLDREGLPTQALIEAWTMWDPAVTVGRVRAGSLGPGRFVVAWQDGMFCPGNKRVPVVRVGETDLASGVVFPAEQIGSGSCEPWSPAILGDGCGAKGAGLFALVERVSGVQGKVIRLAILPYDAQGLAEAVVLAEFPGDAALPPVCAASASGQAFLVFYWEPDAVTKGLRVRALVTGLGGGVLGGPWTLQEVSASGLQTSPLCTPWLSAASGLLDGRFLLVCAMVQVNDQGGVAESSFSWRLLGPDGKPAGDFAPLGIEEQVLAYGASMAPGPGGNVLAAWYETDTLDVHGGWQTTPGWLRMFVLGKGSVW